MAESKVTDFIRIVNDLHKEFTENNFRVTEGMINDLWLIFGDDGAEEAELRFKDFNDQLDVLVRFKMLGGLKEAFLDYIEIKELTQEVTNNSLKNSDAYITIDEAAEEYGIKQKNLYRYISNASKDGKIKRLNDINPATYYRRDFESVLIDNKKLKEITEKTKKIEETFFKLEDKTRRHMKRMNKY